MNTIIAVIVLMLSAAYLIWLLLQDRVAKPRLDKDFLMALFKLGYYRRRKSVRSRKKKNCSKLF